MELAEWCSSSRVIIVAGKGGVGKTTTAAALAVAAARAGRRALLVELEGKSGLASMFGFDAISGEVEAYPGVTVLPLAPDDALTEYLETHGLRRMSKRLVHSGALDIVATAVPGMKEILVLGKVKALQRAGAADVIVVDGPAAGHAVNFLLSPKGILDAVRVGPVLTQAVEVTEMLADPDRAAGPAGRPARPAAGGAAVPVLLRHRSGGARGAGRRPHHRGGRPPGRGVTLPGASPEPPAADTDGPLGRLAAERPVIVCCGSGGGGGSSTPPAPAPARRPPGGQPAAVAPHP